MISTPLGLIAFSLSQDGSVQPRYAATWRGFMQVDLIKVLGSPLFLDKSLSPHEVVCILRAGRFSVMLRASQGRPRYAGRPTSS